MKDNKGMFDELGLEVPKSWTEFQEMADTLLENDITPIAFPGADIGPNQFMNSMMMMDFTTGSWAETLTLRV